MGFALNEAVYIKVHTSRSKPIGNELYYLISFALGRLLARVIVHGEQLQASRSWKEVGREVGDAIMSNSHNIRIKVAVYHVL